MKLSIVSFTENGRLLSEKIEKRMEFEVCLYTKCKACNSGGNSSVLFVENSIAEWTREQMQKGNAMLFIGACGIAVRAAAPSLTDKLHDAPALVMDEKGKYVIPILSGHMGGANELADYIAEKTGAEAVITTATDIQKKFAVDVFAKKNALFIADKDGIVKVSSKALAGEEITLSIEPGHGIDNAVPLPEGIRLVPYPPDKTVDVLAASNDCGIKASVLLRPREYVIGIGCRRGKSGKEIDGFIKRRIQEIGISVTQVYAISSIRQKQDEEGIAEWSRKERIPFFTYTAEELQEVTGDFTESSFVREKAGVGSVCERAAVKACGENGRLTAPKYAKNGMTIAVAKREWKVCF